MVSDNNDNIIRGKALYFSTSQVANVLNEADSKIRYYTNVFDDILHIEISNKQRRYTDADIDKLRFIIELKNEGMTIKQIQEYCQEVDFEDSKEIQIKENNPLSIQAIAKALLEQQSLLINEMRESLIIEFNKSLQIQSEEFDNMKMNLNKDIAITVEETVTQQLNKFKEEFKNDFSENFTKELAVTQELNSKMDNLKLLMEQRKKENEENQRQESKGFLSKLFPNKKR